MSICPKCNRRIAENVKVCPYCGAKISRERNSIPKVISTSQNSILYGPRFPKSAIVNYDDLSGKYPKFSVRFSNDLLTILMRNNKDGRNILASPYRLQAVLMLIAQWASPTIRIQILNVIKDCDMPIVEAKALLSKNLLKLTRQDIAEGIDLDTLWKGLPKLESFTILWKRRDKKANKVALEQVERDFNITLQDFEFYDPNLSSHIDTAIFNITHGFVPHVDLHIYEDTLAAITDVLYFKAFWEYEFKEGDTTDEIFYGTKVHNKVPIMSYTKLLEYRETDYYQCVNLPFKCRVNESRNFTMRIFLPREGHSVEDVLLFIQGEKFDLPMHYEGVNLSLPQFSMESSVDIKQVLADMGLSCIFDSPNIIPHCIKDVKVQEIKQKIKIQVDEDGIEAAAVTSVGMCFGAIITNETKRMNINHPFIFEIVENSTHTILFSGIVNNIGEDNLHYTVSKSNRVIDRKDQNKKICEEHPENNDAPSILKRKKEWISFLR